MSDRDDARGDEASSLDQFMHGLKRRNPGETEFHQAVEEVAVNIIPYIDKHPGYQEIRVLERMTEPVVKIRL